MTKHHATNTHTTTIDCELLLGCNLQATEAGLDLDDLVTYGHTHRIEARMGRAPEFGILDSERNREKVTIDLGLDTLRERDIAIGSEEIDRYTLQSILATKQCDIDTTRSTLLGDVGLMHHHTIGTIVERRDGGLLGDQKFDIAIDTAIEILLDRGGQNIAARGVAHSHQERVVVAIGDVVGDLEGEGGVASVVVTHVAAIDEGIGNILHSVEAEEEAFALPLGRNKECALIVGKGATIALATHEGIDIPGVRQRHLASVVARVLLGVEELPTAIQRVYFAC